MSLRRTLVATIVMVVSLIAAPSGATALTPIFSVTAAKEADGDYQPGVQNASLDDGQTRLFFWKVKSNDNVDQSMSFDDAATGDAGGEDYKIKWYKGKRPRASKNVSNTVKNAGYDFTLKAGKRKYFTAKVTALPAAGGVCLGGQASNDPQTFVDAAYFGVDHNCN